MSQSLRLTVGGNIYYGGSGTEYGGFRIVGADLTQRPADSAFCWLSWYF
jgi:hypothetical protein